MTPKHQPRWLSIFPIILFALALVDLATAAPQATPTTTSSPTPSPTSSPNCNNQRYTCGFAGDDNTYGLGIRIGVYLQWVCSSIAYNFVPDEAITMRGVNMVFTMSNFAGLLYITAFDGQSSPSGQLYAVECWIVLSFCLGGVCSGQVHDSEKGTSTSMTFAGYKASAIGRVIQFLLWAAMVYYTIWFLYVGMDTMEATSCSRYAFFFTKVDLFHWFRTFLKVFFTLAAILFSFSIIISCFSFIPFVTSKEGLIALFSFTNPEGEHHYPFNFSLSFAMVFFILSTELVIHWNHIQGVNTIKSTGQILPVVVGGGSLIRVLWKFFLLMCGAAEVG